MSVACAGADSQLTSRMSLRSSGLQESGRASSPRVLSGSRARRSSCSFFPEGACGTTGRFTAPAAPCAAKHMATVCRKHTANTATEAAIRLRSAREWTLRLAACPRGCHWRRRAPVRASCRPDMHLDRPPVVAGVCPLSRRQDQRSRKQSQGSGIVAATASRSAYRRRSPRAPYRDGMADKFS